MKKSAITPVLFILMTAWLLGANAGSKKASSGNNVKDFEKIVDQFEEEILKKDQENFRVGAGDERSELPEAKYETRLKSQTIEGGTKESKVIGTVSTGIQKIDNEIDDLAKDIDALRQEIKQTASIDNKLDLEVRLTDPSAALIKSLDVKVDGFTLYSTNDSAHLSLPASSIPVYSGPIPAGAHKIDVSARVALIEKGGSALKADGSRNESKTFELTMPVGRIQSHFVVEIVAPADGKGKLEIRVQKKGEEKLAEAPVAPPTQPESAGQISQVEKPAAEVAH
jgi:hypothetical protein